MRSSDLSVPMRELGPPARRVAMRGVVMWVSGGE